MRKILFAAWARRWSALRVSFLLVMAVVTVAIPIWMVLVNAAKPLGEAEQLGLGLPHHWRLFQNLHQVIVEGSMVSGFLTTLSILVPSVATIVLASSAAAWVFGRARGRLATIVYFALISGILLPTAIVTTLQIMRWLGLAGTIPGIVLFYTGIFTSTGIFLVTGFVKTIPIEIEEAARIDGAGPFTIFFRIILPLLRPVLATTSFIMTLFIWNDFFNPFFILPEGKQTMTTGLYNFVSSSRFGVNWNLVFADVLLMSAPMVILFSRLQRSLLTGLLGASSK